MSEATGVGGSQTRLFEGRRPDLGSEGRRPHVFRSLRAILNAPPLLCIYCGRDFKVSTVFFIHQFHNKIPKCIKCEKSSSRSIKFNSAMH